MHALPCTLHYRNRGHLAKCSAKNLNISSASLVSWLLNCSEHVIKNFKISLKEQFYIHCLLAILINSSCQYCHNLQCMGITEKNLASCLASAEEMFENVKCIPINTNSVMF